MVPRAGRIEDDRMIRVKIVDNCRVCGSKVSEGSTAYYSPSTRTIRHTDCWGG